MLPVVDRPTLHGVQLAVQDLHAAKTFAEQVLGLQRDATAGAEDGQKVARFRLGAHWLGFEQKSFSPSQGVSSSNVATLHWGCSNLPRQRTLLAQLGFDSQDESAPDEATHVRIAAAETGACAIQWCGGRELTSAGPPPSRLGITALVLPARAPERAAAHWAQIFQMQAERHAAGLPRLLLGGIHLQFVFAEDDAGGVAGLTVTLDDVGAARERARARGLIADGEVVSLAGLRVSLASATTT